MKKIGTPRVTTLDWETRVKHTLVRLRPTEVRRLWNGSKRQQRGPARFGFPLYVRRFRDFRNEAIDTGIVERPGCDCRACQADYDCCGNMVPGYITVRRVRSNVFEIEQRFNRNC